MFLVKTSLFVTAFLALLTVSTALSTPPSLKLMHRDTPLLPSQDPFYTPSGSGWESQPPGTILKSRKVDIGSLAVITPTVLQAAYQLLYRTTNALGQPSFSVTTIMIPIGADMNKLMSYHVAYDSPDENCSPSYGLQYGASADADQSTFELTGFMTTFLVAGIPISVPDYEGHDAAFTVGTQTAYGVLDSIRAVLNSTSITSISSKANVTLVGYSGGALASEWASEIQNSYAPELHIAGAAYGGIPVNTTATALAVNEAPAAGLIPAALLGIAKAFPSVADYVKTHLRPNSTSIFNLPLTECNSNDLNSSYGYNPALANKDIFSCFDNGDRILYDQAPLLNEIGIMGRHGIPEMPTYIWKGTADEIAVTLEETDALVAKFCAAGAKISYVRVVNGTHESSALAGYPGAVKFITDIYGGKAPSECSTVNITNI